MPPFIRNHFTWLAYLLLAFYGYFLNILGPLTPFLKEELSLSYTVASLHFTAFAVGILLVGLFGHLVIKRVGRWPALWLGAGGMSLGALLLVAGRSPWMTIGASFLMGLVGSLILAIIPSVLSDQYGEQRAVALSEANVVSSLISTAAPLLVGWFAALPGGWRTALLLGAVTPLLLRLGFGKAVPPTLKGAGATLKGAGATLKGADATRRSPAAGVQAARAPLPRLFWVYWAALVLAVSVEFCMISWSADFLETGLSVPKAEAAQAVSLFLAAMILGRLAGSRLVRRFATHAVVTSSIGLAGAGFLLFWTTQSAFLGMAGLFFTGLGVASLYPLIISLAIGAAGGDTALASARATLASGTAILLLPLVLGRLADAVGIRPAYGVVIVLLVSVFGLVWFTRRSQAAVDREPEKAEERIRL